MVLVSNERQLSCWFQETEELLSYWFVVSFIGFETIDERFVSYNCKIASMKTLLAHLPNYTHWSTYHLEDIILCRLFRIKVHPCNSCTCSIHHSFSNYSFTFLWRTRSIESLIVSFGILVDNRSVKYSHYVILKKLGDWLLWCPQNHNFQ